MVWPPTRSAVLAMLKIKWLCLHLAYTCCMWFGEGVCVYGSLETGPSASSMLACSVRYYNAWDIFGGRRPGRFYHVMCAATYVG